MRSITKKSLKLSPAQFEVLALLRKYPKSRLVWGFMSNIIIEDLPVDTKDERIHYGKFDVRWTTFSALDSAGLLRRVAMKKRWCFPSTGEYTISTRGRRAMELTIKKLHTA